LHTTKQSPSPSAAIAFASCGLSLYAPLIFSANILAQPQACNASVCACSVWPSVLTLAYPIVAIVLFLSFVKKKPAPIADFCFAQMFRILLRRFSLPKHIGVTFKIEI
jgi:hypothetical protein